MNRDIHSDYKRLLARFEWAEFSDGVKERKGHFCESCEVDENLEVHHLGYRNGRKPWEYDDNDLMVVCRDCHAEIHSVADEVWNEILKCKNSWVLYECLKSVRQTIAKHDIAKV